MPARWSCKCGTQVPLALSFCGQCGTRWDKVAKGKQPSNNRPKTQAKEEKEVQSPDPSDGHGFAVPSVGLPWQTEKAKSQSLVPPRAPQQKTLQTIIHQKANRVGKVNARIRKLEESLAFVQTGWPSHVQSVQKELHNKYIEVCRFQSDVKAELIQLKQELNQLSVLGQVPQIPAPLDVNMFQQVQTAMEVLTAAGMTFSPYTGVPEAPAHMEVDQQQFEFPQEFVLPNLAEVDPSVQFPFQHPVGHVGQMHSVPVQVPSAVHNTAAVCQGMSQVQNPPQPACTKNFRPPAIDLEIPPGNWDPEIPQHFPNPLYKAPQAMPAVPPVLHPETPILPVAEEPKPLMHWQYAPTPAPINAEVAAAVANAIQGLQEQHVLQQMPGGPEMPEQYQKRIDNFTLQQNQLQQQMEQLQQMIPKTPAKQPQHAQRIPGTSAPINAANSADADVMSIHSTPQRVDRKTGVTPIPLSPQAMREPKVAKAVPGAIHEQPKVNGFTTPIPVTPSNSPRSPTPVPTEIAESEWPGPQGAADGMELLE